MARHMAWRPLHDVIDMQNEMVNAMMEQMAPNGGTSQRERRSGSFPVDLIETSEAYVLHAVMPGVPADQFTIDFADGVLTIKATAPAPTPVEGERHLINERVSGTYQRNFRFATPINSDQIEAGYEQGILTLRLPKAEVVRARRIQVQGASEA